MKWLITIFILVSLFEGKSSLAQYHDKPQTFREAFSVGLRRGIGNLLEELKEEHNQRHQNKLEDIKNERISNQLQNLGVSKNEADYIATLPPELQYHALQTYAENVRRAEEKLCQQQENLSREYQRKQQQKITYEHQLREQHNKAHQLKNENSVPYAILFALLVFIPLLFITIIILSRKSRINSSKQSDKL